MSTLARSTHYNSCIRLYFQPFFFEVKPHAITRQAVLQWFIQIGQKSHVTANHAIGLLRTLHNKMRVWGVYDGPNPTDGINWVKIRDRAQLPDVRPYDLRRTCASWLAINGENAVLIAKVLNHTNLQCTGIYTRLNTAPVSRALNAHEDQVIGCDKKHVIHSEPFRDVAPHDAGIVDVSEARNDGIEPEWPG
jgi:hypothetical protein